MSAEYGLVADDIADSRQASRVARAFAQGAVLHCPHFMSVLPPASAMVGVQHVAILLERVEAHGVMERGITRRVLAAFRVTGCCWRAVRARRLTRMPFAVIAFYRVHRTRGLVAGAALDMRARR